MPLWRQTKRVENWSEWPNHHSMNNEQKKQQTHFWQLALAESSDVECHQWSNSTGVRVFNLAEGRVPRV